MRAIEGRRPSPALLVAVIALVAALAGSAAALPGKNNVDKNDIKKNAVKKKAIAKNAVTSAKIGANQVKGVDVDESSLGQVPSAASADAVSYLKQINVRMSFGEDVELVSNGPVSLRARCLLNANIDGVAARDGVQIYARTTEAGSFLNGTDNRFGDTNGDGLVDAESLDPTDAINDSTFVAVHFATGGPNEQFVGDGAFDQGTVVSPGGTAIALHSSETILGIRGLGSDCAVIGLAQLRG